MKKILVTGASGQLGGTVVKTLLKHMPPEQISVITRQENKRLDFESRGLNAFTGSYELPASLEAAMYGVDMVLLISSGDQGDRMQEHKNVVDAAKKAGVQCIAYTGRSLHDRNTLANTLMEQHFETEDYIKASGLNYTFFRNILYMDAIPQFIGGIAALDRGIFLPAGNGRVAFAMRSDQAEAMANVLIHKPCENKTYNFTGNTNYSFYDIAEVLSELSGKEVKYTNIDEHLFECLMLERNIPAQAVRKIMDFVTDIRHNQEAGVSHELEHEMGRTPMSLKEGLKHLFEL